MTSRETAKSVLVTGATGVVGSEVARQIAAVPGIELVQTSSSGAEGCVAWNMGSGEPDPELRRHFDVVVHAAARTRWSQTPVEAEQGNLQPAHALSAVVDDDTHLVFLSTAHAIGNAGSSSDDVADYRNAYEWSKARAERFVEATFDHVSIVRFPMVVGRRTDGHVARFSGFYKVLNGLCSGLLPAVVGEEKAHLDLVPVDDLARRIVAIATGPVPEGTSRSTIAGGTAAPAVSDALDVAYDTLDRWRLERQIAPLKRPPLLVPERWDRFYWPFTKDEFSPVQRRAIEIFMEFRPYLSMPAPFDVTDVVCDVLPALARSVRYWADENPRAASATAEAWS